LSRFSTDVIERPSRTDSACGSASVEFTALAAAIALLFAGLSWAGAGHDLGNLVANTVAGAVEPEQRSTRTRFSRISVPVGTASRSTALSASAWDRSTTRELPGGLARAEFCVVCAGGSLKGRVDVGLVGMRGVGGGRGVAVDARVGVFGALARARAMAHAAVGRGETRLSGAGEASVTLGAEADARLQLVARRDRQRFAAVASAVAGARARLEQSASLQVASIALEQAAAVEGWAGAGARASLDVERSGSKLSWSAGAGAALGFGGALELSGSVDVTGSSLAQSSIVRQAARSVVLAGVGGPALAAADLARWGSRRKP
jgi:hypothetical protein